MSEDVSSDPINQPRRRDRAVDDDAWIAALLHRLPWATLATVDGGQPFLNSNLFVFDAAQHTIFMHTARYGRTRQNVENVEQEERAVCLSVSEMGRLLPAATALDFSVEYTGVVVFGRARVLHDREEARQALQMLLDKYFRHLRPGEHYRPITDDELKRTAVYRIEIDQWSGKQKQVPADFPGAFCYGDAPPTVLSLSIE